MKRKLFVLAALACAAFAEDGIRIPLSDPGRPCRVIVHTLNGSIRVTAGAPGVVVIGTKEMARHRERERSDGLHRIPMQRGLNAEESENTVTINGGPPDADGDIFVEVPPNTSLKANSVSGEVKVDGLNGDLEANANNGKIVLTNISGSVVASSLNGGVHADVVRVEPNKPMSFSSLNGEIDVTLPADTRARLKMKTDNGELYTDFDVLLEHTGAPVVEDHGGRHRIKQDRTTYGTINGGGPEMSFTSLNGNIYIRKRK